MKWWIALLMVIWTGHAGLAQGASDGNPEGTAARNLTEDARLGSGKHNYHQAVRSYRQIGDLIGVAAAKWMVDEAGQSQFWTAARDDPSFNISGPCLASLMDIFLHLRPVKDIPLWAIRFLDAQPKPPSSVLEGNIAWLGGFHQCMNLTVYRDASDPTPANKLLEGKYCLVTIAVNASVPSGDRPKASPLMQIPKALRLGLCAPDTCSATDVRVIAELAIFIFGANASSFIPGNLSVSDVHCPAKEIPMDAAAVTMIVILVVFATLVAIGTIYDVLTRGLFLDTEEDQVLLDGTQQPASHYTTLLPSDAIAASELDTEFREGRGIVGRICLGLSAVSNTRRILRSRETTDELAWIHGLRVLSMVWIILGQSYAIGLPVFNNLLMLPEAMKGLFTQIIIQSTFAVDTFLFLSGYLVAFRFLKELAGGFDCVRLIRFYINRYTRLFPAYMIILGVYATLTKYISSGPLWPQDEVMLGNCSHLAWANAFYVSNYVQPDQMCMPWTYYIAIDFQLFTVAPLVVWALWAIWQAGVALCVAGVLVAVIAAGVISKVMELPPSLVGFGSTDVSAFDQDLTIKYFTSYLITSYCRAAPYFIGILAAFFLRDPLHVHRSSFLTICLGWITALVGIALVVFGLVPGFNGHPLSVDTSAAFNSLSHVVWAGALSWVAYSCVTGAVKAVNRFLGWAAWRPISAISYSVYLVAPIMICVYYLSREETVRFSHWNTLTVFGGTLLMSLLVGFLVYVLIEAPVRCLVRLLLRPRASYLPNPLSGMEKI